MPDPLAALAADLRREADGSDAQGNAYEARGASVGATFCDGRAAALRSVATRLDALAPEIAAERDALAAEVERQRAALSTPEGYRDAVADAVAEEVERLRAEVERLRALVRDAHHEGWESAASLHPDEEADWLASDSRAALGGGS